MSLNAPVLIERVGAVARLRLNRPEKLNSFTLEMSLVLQRALDECERDESVRALLLTGVGRAFCAGQDLAICQGELPDLGEVVRATYNPLVKCIRRMEKPIVAAVNGVAAGAGANLAFCCDLAVAADIATFIQSFVRIGLIPDTGGSFLLPRLIGPARAAELTLLGEKLSAPDALALGLISRVVPSAELESTSLALAERLANSPTRAIGLTKRAFNEAIFPDLDELLEREAMLQSLAGATEDFREGVAAFAEKREPRFVGR